jgi:hypothetical protein
MGNSVLRVFLALGILVGATARADDRGDRARTFYESGMAHFQLEEFDAAIEAWENGFRAKPVPEFLYNIAQAYRLSKRPEKALTFYRNYLRMNPDAPNKAEVQKHMAQLQRAVDENQKASNAAPLITKPITGDATASAEPKPTAPAPKPAAPPPPKPVTVAVAPPPPAPKPATPPPPPPKPVTVAAAPPPPAPKPATPAPAPKPAVPPPSKPVTVAVAPPPPPRSNTVENPAPEPRVEREPAPPPTKSSPQRADVTAPAPAKKPITKQPWFWGVVGGGAALVVGAVIVGVVVGTNTPTPSLPSLTF